MRVSIEDEKKPEEKQRKVSKEKQKKELRKKGQHDAKVVLQSDRRVLRIAEKLEIDRDPEGNPRSAANLRDDIKRSGEQILRLINQMSRRKNRTLPHSATQTPERNLS